jgi:methionyl aminopeptidase
MVTLGSPETDLLDDGWTVRTADGSRAAHFEHTVAITADGPWVLTAEDGGRAGLARGAATAHGSPERYLGEGDPASRKVPGAW